MHHIIDAQAEFAQGIVQDFVSEYRSGRTPNPCIKCNDIIKFRLLLDYARSNGFDFLATGHYARIAQDQAVSRVLLKKGTDSDKDQSYFLYRLTQEQMQSILFHSVKYASRRRKLARERDLPRPSGPRARKSASCRTITTDLFKEHAPETLRPGDMVTTDGKVVGRHNGIAFSPWDSEENWAWPRRAALCREDRAKNEQGRGREIV
jgi:tRNA-specific 2-thiouridylase